MVMSLLQKPIQSIKSTDHLDHSVLGCYTGLPFGLMPRYLSLSLALLPSLFAPLTVCHARVVV